SWASYKQKFTNWFQEIISSINLYALLTLVPKYAPKKFSKLTDMNSDLDGQISLRNYEQAVDKREKLIVLDYIDQVGPIVYDKNMKAQILQLSKY
ncbi:MAG: hypothetical protein MHPSP_003901, partial [Paramarteilia canceri]